MPTPSPINPPILCRVPAWLRDWLDRQAQNEDRSLNKQVVHILREVAEQHGVTASSREDATHGH